MYKIERVYDYPKEMQRNKKVKQLGYEMELLRTFPSFTISHIMV